MSQPSFNNRTAGFTIDDYPSIDISLKAGPGYTAGVLNHTSFTFSNDVREVDIFATAASYSPNITYNGNMNVFLSTYLSSTTKIFEITTGTQKDNIGLTEYVSEAFALTLANDGDQSVENLNFNYKDNFYNLDPNCKYKITALKIGDTSLSDTDLSDGDPTISSTSNSTYIDASISKDWVKSVYKQCTGKDITMLQPPESVAPTNMDNFLQDNSKGYLGQQIAERLYEEKVAESLINILIPNGDSKSPFFKTLSADKRSEFESSIEFFMTSYKTNTTGLKDANLVQNYFNVLKQFQDRYANDATATSILKKYNPLENDDFKKITLNFDLDIFKIIYNIDPSNTYGFTSSLNGGLAYVLWLFYAYYVVMFMLLTSFSEFTPDDPIISTIPVSITFSSVTQ